MTKNFLNPFGFHQFGYESTNYKREGEKCGNNKCFLNLYGKNNTFNKTIVLGNLKIVVQIMKT